MDKIIPVIYMLGILMLVLPAIINAIINKTLAEIVLMIFGFYWIFPTDRFKDVEYFSDV